MSRPMVPSKAETRRQALTLSNWTFGVILALDRRQRFAGTATDEQVAGVYSEPMPSCCSEVRMIAERWKLSVEQAEAILDVWECWYC